MNYYEILKQRRLDLKLSIQDVSAQTRLAPEYIQAIEENNLDVFADDLSFVRYFIRSYCQAIGVNWEAVQEEVDGSIKYYAHMRNMALTQAQKKMVQSMPQATQTETAKKNRKRKKSKARYQSRVNRTTRRLTAAPRRKISKKAAAVIACAVLVLAAGSFAYDRFMASRTAATETDRQAEIKAKEAETARLAAQRKKAQGIVDEPEQAAPAPVVTQQDNAVEVRMALPGTLQVDAAFPGGSTLYFYNGQEALSDPAAVVDTYSQPVNLQQEALLTLGVTNGIDMTLNVAGTPIAVTPSEDGSAYLEIHVVPEVTDEPAQ